MCLWVLGKARNSRGTKRRTGTAFYLTASDTKARNIRLFKRACIGLAFYFFSIGTVPETGFEEDLLVHVE